MAHVKLFASVTAIIAFLVASLTPLAASAQDLDSVPNNPDMSVNALYQFTDKPTPVITGTPSTGHDLVVEVGNWVPAPATLDIAWMLDGQVISTDSFLTVDAGWRGHQITVSTTASASGYETITKTSKAVTALDVFTPEFDLTIPQTIFVGDKVTFAVPSISPTPSSVTYQWLRNGTVIRGKTGARYTASDADEWQQLSVRLTAKLNSYETLVMTSNVSNAVTRHSFETVNAPTLSTYTPEFGVAITSSLPDWSPMATEYKYQWLRDTDTAITGATKKTYTPKVADIGHTLKLRVTGSRATYVVTTQISDATAVVTEANMTTPGVVTISGEAVSGKKLTAVPGTWSPRNVAFTYTWFRDSVEIPGANKAKYKLTDEDVTHYISVSVTGTLVGYATQTIESSQTAAVLGTFTDAPTPVITGVRELGGTLFAEAGYWSPEPDFLNFQWFRDGVAIAGEESDSYTLQSSDASHNITVRVTATKAGYADTTKTSAAAKWVVKQYTLTLSANQLFNHCENVGGTFEPCDMSNGYLWLYGDGNGDSATITGYEITLPKRPVRWKISFNKVWGRDGTTWTYYPADYETFGTRENIYPRYYEYQYLMSKWTNMNEGRNILFALGTWDYSSLYIGGAVITYEG